MKKDSYVFGHRGAMGYIIENTLPSFKKAVEMGADIETDLKLSKDGIIFCFHDPVIKIGAKTIGIENLTLKQITKIHFKDNRKIPTLKEVFEEFQNIPKEISYSFDISSKKVGKKAIDLAKKYSVEKNIFITDQRLIVLSFLRKYDSEVHLVHTLFPTIKKLDEKQVNFEKLSRLMISAINIRNNEFTKHNFEFIIKKGFNVFIWDINSRSKMKEFLQLDHEGKKAKGFYTNFPDIFFEIRDEVYGQ